MGQVSDGYGEVCDGFALVHHLVPVCRRRCYQVYEGIVGVLPSFSEVVRAVVSRRPGGDFLFPLLFALCRLEVCLGFIPGGLECSLSSYLSHSS